MPSARDAVLANFRDVVGQFLGELAELAEQLGRGRPGIVDLAHLFARGLFGQLREIQHEIQRIPDLVGDPRGQRAQRGELGLDGELVDQPLPLNQRPDARAQQDGVERLEQVILGAHFDGSDDAVDLIERRDHDYGHRAHAAVLPHPFEHFEAVHHRHHDVEQHDVERLGGDAVERHLSVGRLLDGIPLALQAAAQDVSVRRVVVHHQDARAGRFRARRAVGLRRARRGSGSCAEQRQEGARGLTDAVEIGDPLRRRSDAGVVTQMLEAGFDPLHAGLYFLAQRVDLRALHRLAIRERRVDVGECGARRRMNLPQASSAAALRASEASSISISEYPRMWFTGVRRLCRSSERAACSIGSLERRGRRIESGSHRVFSARSRAKSRTACPRTDGALVAATHMPPVGARDSKCPKFSSWKTTR